MSDEELMALAWDKLAELKNACCGSVGVVKDIGESLRTFILMAHKCGIVTTLKNGNVEKSSRGGL